MPNHFHFMLVAKARGCEPVFLKEKATDLQWLSKAIGKTLSSYTQAINIQNNTTGNLFQKKTKAKCLSDVSFAINQFPITEYLINCFYYIHFNPLEARLVKKLDDWPYSSWPDYFGLRKGDLCNKEKAIELLGITNFDPSTAHNFAFDQKILERIW